MDISLTESDHAGLGNHGARILRLPMLSPAKRCAATTFNGKKALLVMFICAHCPYVKHIEKALGALGKDYAGTALAIVAISTNDVTTHPDDSPAGLKQQAEISALTFRTSTTRRRLWPMPTRLPARPIFFFSMAISAPGLSRPVRLQPPRQRHPVTGEDLRAAID